MPLIGVNGVRLHYDDAGTGPAVLFIAGTGARGRTWHLHQVPALVAAGFRVVTFDNRGIPPSDVPATVTLAGLVADADDLLAPPARGRDVAAAIPGARYLEIADAGHYGYLEQPAAVNAALLTFLTPKELA